MNMLMDSMSEGERDLLLEIRHIQRSGYNDDEEYDDDFYEEKQRRHGHKTWE